MFKPVRSIVVILFLVSTLLSIILPFVGAAFTVWIGRFPGHF